MRGNLETRVANLETRSWQRHQPVLVVGPYARGANPDPYISAAREVWRERFGEYPADEVRTLHIVLCGVEERGDAVP